MSNLGTLEFQVHLKDYTDAEADKIKKKLENLSVQLTIDGKNVKVLNTDDIKKQIEAAVKSIAIQSVSVDANAIKQQVEAATKSATPQVSVTLLKGSLSSDIQKYLDNKTFKIKLSVLKADSRKNIVSALSTFSIPVKVTVKASAIVSQLRQDLAGKSVPLDVRARDAKSFIQDLEQKLSKKNLKLSVTANKKELQKSITDALAGKTYKADLKLNVKQMDVQDAIKQAFAKAGMSYSTSASDLRAARIQEIQQRMAIRAAQAHRDLANAYRGSASGAYESARASVTLGGSLRTNIRLAGELGTSLGNLASVFGLKDILQNVVQIGGQLENQKIALSAILQDGGKATTMFSKIQSLAVKSPFGIMDLNQYAKQLSAYSVPYNELYETMKRLADISAGVGVDMGRIILAFGQVKAAGFLKGTELRQFTEANIPMVAKLAERFGELENRMVSAGEVYDMISEKKVTFEDVKSVLWDLTGEGGMFNNMQEVLSESLASKWKNLSDAVDVMYGKMSEGFIGSGLKKTAETLTEMTKNWEYIATAIGTALGAYATYKTAVILGSKQIAMAQGTYGFLLKNKQQEAAMLRQEALYRKLNKSEIELISTSGKLTNADIKKAVTSGMLNKQEALRLITLGKLDKAMLRGVQRTLQISNAEIRAAQNATFLRRAWATLQQGMSGLLSSMKAFLFNPWTLWIAGITAITEAVTYFAKKNDEANERIKNGAQAAAEGYNNLRESIKSFDNAPTSEGGMMSSLSEMNSLLKDYAANWAEIMAEIYKRNDEGEYVYSLSERYKLLNEKLIQTKEAYRLIAQSMEGMMEAANQSTDGWTDESFVENLKDASDAMGNYRKALREVTINSVHYEAAMRKAIEADEAFAEVASGKSFSEQIRLLKDYSKAYSAFAKEGSMNDGFYNFSVFTQNLQNAQRKALEDAKKFMESYKKLLEGRGWNLDNLSEPQRMAIAADFTKYFDSIEGLDEETKKMFLQETIEKELHINVTMDFVEEATTEKWKTELIQAAGGENLQVEVDGIIKAAADYDSVVESIRTLYKDANTLIEDLKPVLLKVGLTADGKNELTIDNFVQVLDPETQKALDEYNKAIRQRQAAINIATDQGFLLDKEKKKGGNSKDPVAEMWKKRADEIAKAVKMYDDWKKVEGKLMAENRVKYNEELANLFNGAYGFVLDLEEPTEVYKYIRAQLDESKERQKELKVQLGVKMSDAELKDAQDALKDFLENTKTYIEKTTKGWDLYKTLFAATWNKTVSMNIAFGGEVAFKDRLEELKAKILEVMEELGVGVSFEELLEMDSQGITDKGWKGVFELVEAYKKEQNKMKEESIKNFAEIIKASKDFSQQIADIETKLAKDLEDLRKNSKGYAPSEVKRMEDELIRKAEEDIANVRFEEFKKSSDWVKVFDDLDRVSNDTLDNMIEKVAEFAEEANLSEKVTKQLVDAMSKLRNETIERNPFKGFKDAWGRMGAIKDAFKRGQMSDGLFYLKQSNGTFKGLTEKELNDEKTAANEDLKNSALAVADKFQAVANAADLLSGLFENLGIDLGAISDVFGGAASGATTGAGIVDAFGIKNAGPWGAVAGAAVGMLSSVFAMHDKALEKEIEASKAREAMIKNIADTLEKQLERTMGGIYKIGLDSEARNTMVNLMNAVDPSSWQKNSRMYSLETRQKAEEAYDENSYYDAQLAMLMAQRDELSKQREAEADKKDSDAQKIADYEDSIKELEMSIDDFAKDMAEKLYGIDFKDWADQLTNAIVDAWASGEDAAEAYKNTVNDILKQVGISAISQQIMQPLIEEQMKGFLSQFEADNGVLTDKSMKYLANIQNGSKKAVEATTAYLEGLKELGVDLSDASDSAGGLSKGIEGVTEDTASLLASYLNSIRADVSVNRTLFEQLVKENVPKMSMLAEAQLQQLQMIVSNTSKNVALVGEIRDLVNKVVDKSNNKLRI